MTQHKLDETIAALHFVKGQLLFEYTTDKGTTVSKCISPQAARQAFLQQQFDSDWIAPHTCRYGDGANGPWILQRYPAATYTLSFETPILTATASLPSLTIPLPDLLFLGTGQTYFLFTYRVWHRSDTTLYHAPLPNVDSNGAICFGDSPPPLASHRTMANAWDLFWRADFTPHHITDKSRAYPKNILDQLLAVHTQRLPTYPLSDLKRAGISLPEMIASLQTTQH